MIAKALLHLAPIGALALAGPLLAQPLPEDTIDPSKMLPAFDVQSIDDTLKTVTGNHIATVAKDGSTIISAYSPDGLQFSIHFHRCEGDENSQCGALQLLTSWEVGENKAPYDQLIAQSAPRYMFVNVGRLPQGNPYMSRVVLAGQGISQGNLAEEVRLFLDFATQFGTELRAIPQQ